VDMLDHCEPGCRSGVGGFAVWGTDSYAGDSDARQDQQDCLCWCRRRVAVAREIPDLAPVVSYCRVSLCSPRDSRKSKAPRKALSSRLGVSP